ncbi:MAG: hypothetical protein ABIC95_02165 [archaeon]
MTQILHSPRLNTVMMVERTLEDAGELLTIAGIKRRLPKKVMHQTLLHILDYLQASGKIIIGTKGVLWTYMPREELDRLIKEGIEM